MFAHQCIKTCMFCSGSIEESNFFIGLYSTYNVAHAVLNGLFFRCHLSRYNCNISSTNANERDTFPKCWALTDPNTDNIGDSHSSGGTIWLASEATQTSSVLSTVTCAGPFKDSSANGTTSFFPLTIKSFLKSHNGACPLEFKVCYPVSRHIVVLYSCLLQSPPHLEARSLFKLSLLDEDDNGEIDGNEQRGDRSSSSIQILLEWSRPRSLLEQPSPDARAVVQAWIQPGTNQEL